jgi:hypothetical protein
MTDAVLLTGRFRIAPFDHVRATGKRSDFAARIDPLASGRRAAGPC